jgi:ribosomal protein S18 acetylase RimI-like enzyme
VLEIRSAKPGEGAAIANVYVAAAHHAYATILNESYHREHLDDQLASGHWVSHYESAINDDHCELWVAEENFQIVGFALVVPVNEHEGELEQLFFLPEAMGRGIGSAVHDTVMDTARRRDWSRLRLTVVGENARAVAFYRTQGWSESSRQSRTTRGGDTVTMCELTIAVPPLLL